MNETHQLLVYADHLLGENILKEKTEALLVTSKEVGLEVSTKRKKYMFMSHEQKAGENHN
jgi:hypothetical protein